jgi:hypothetical protein
MDGLFLIACVGIQSGPIFQKEEARLLLHKRILLLRKVCSKISIIHQNCSFLSSQVFPMFLSQNGFIPKHTPFSSPSVSQNMATRTTIQSNSSAGTSSSQGKAKLRKEFRSLEEKARLGLASGATPEQVRQARLNKNAGLPINATEKQRQAKIKERDEQQQASTNAAFRRRLVQLGLPADCIESGNIPAAARALHEIPGYLRNSRSVNPQAIEAALAPHLRPKWKNKISKYKIPDNERRAQESFIATN